jgi:hypothetical protein
MQSPKTTEELDLRCRGKKQAVRLPNGLIEIKCDSRICGAQQGVVVLHRFDPMTGNLIETKCYKSPNRSAQK